MLTFDLTLYGVVYNIRFRNLIYEAIKGNQYISKPEIVWGTPQCGYRAYYQNILLMEQNAAIIFYYYAFQLCSTYVYPNLGIHYLVLMLITKLLFFDTLFNVYLLS